MAKEKKINFELIPRDHAPYAILNEMRKHHPELVNASIALAWRTRLKSDKDGHLVLGKCVKASDLQRELVEYDFVILLNREVWEEDFNDAQKCALMDHELCHVTVAKDEDGFSKQDERGRPVWRTRKHDIEEFQAIIERHGFYKNDLERFAEEALKRRKTPLLNQVEDGAALAPAAVMGGTHQRGKKQAAPVQ